MLACFYIRGEQVKPRRGMTCKARVARMSELILTCKGIKREATCGLAFDARQVMCLHNDEEPINDDVEADYRHPDD